MGSKVGMPQVKSRNINRAEKSEVDSEKSTRLKKCHSDLSSAKSSP